MQNSVSLPHYGFADDPHTCTGCGQTIHLTPLVTLDRQRFHVKCWSDRMAHEIRVWEGEAR